MKAFIIHGAYGNPQENWFPWLKEKLESLGWKVYVPKFPTPEGQTLENWMKVFGNYIPLVDKDTVFIGHSLGVPFILHLLERLEKPVKASYLVAGFSREIGIPEFDKINASFLGKFDWDRIRENCREFVVFHSDNDPYVPLELGKEVAEKLNAKFILVSGAGHFNEKAGYTEFPRLLDEIVSANF